MHDSHFSALLLGSIRNDEYEASWHSPGTWKVVQIVIPLPFVEIKSKDPTSVWGEHSKLLVSENLPPSEHPS